MISTPLYLSGQPNKFPIYKVFNAMYEIMYEINWSNSTRESITFAKQSWIDGQYFSIGTYWKLRTIFTEELKIQLKPLFKQAKQAITKENIPNMDANLARIYGWGKYSDTDSNKSKLGIDEYFLDSMDTEKPVELLHFTLHKDNVRFNLKNYM